jgi:type VI secretion system protein ImpA
MPLREDILQPISETNPAGENLRYAPVYDKIKEARRQDDDANQGEWQRERKLAEYPVVIKLASEAIAKKSKDLQLAAWLTEALLHTQGYAGLREGLELIRALVETYWEGLWPELDDGDAEMRAAPIDWVGQYLNIPAKRVPITKSGYDYLKYQEARAVGNEPGDDASEAKITAYQTAISDGKLPLDVFDKAVAGTPAEFYEQSIESIDGCLQVMEDSQPLFEEKFGDVAPSYGRLKEAIEEVRRVLKSFLQKKNEAEAPAATEAEPAAAAEADDGWGNWSASSEQDESAASEEQTETAAPAARKARRRATSGAEPADKDDAAARVAVAAAFWRREDPESPAPYLMLRGMRWGEIRASGGQDASLFEAPSTEVRTSLKKMLGDGSYTELLEVAEEAMSEPCGRAWLDLQRYVVTACEQLGYSATASAICAELKLLVRDYPDLLTSTLTDDTPTANNETLKWIAGFAEAAPAPSWSAPPPPELEETEDERSGQDSEAPEAGPDAFQLAMDAVRGGRTEEAITILAEEIAHQTSGRGKFQRKLQLAQVCLSTGQESIAHSLLEELAAAVDRHQLEDWESPELVAHALSLLYTCVGRTDMDPAAKNGLYARICRLSPVQALRHGGQALAHGR